MKPVKNQMDAGLNSKGKPRSVNLDGSQRKPSGKRRSPRPPPKPVSVLESAVKRAAVLTRWYGKDAAVDAQQRDAQAVQVSVQPLYRKALLDQALARVELIQRLGKVLPEVVETVAELMRGVNRVTIRGIETETPVKADVRLAAARQLAEWARLGAEDDRRSGGEVDSMTIDQLDSLIEAGRAELLERAAQQRVINQEPDVTSSTDPTRIRDVM